VAAPCNGLYITLVNVDNASAGGLSCLPSLIVARREFTQRRYPSVCLSVCLSFFPRDCSLARLQSQPLSSCGVCLSVCPSVCLGVRYVHILCQNQQACPQTFSPSGSHHYFPYQTLWQYSDGTTPNGGPRRNTAYLIRRLLMETGGVCKNRDFRPISRFISEMTPYRAIITIECK